MPTQHLVLPAALLLALTLSACGGGSATPADSSTPELPIEQMATSETADAAFSENDVTFLQNMIPHHEQADEMADLAIERTERPELEEFARGIVDKRRCPG